MPERTLTGARERGANTELGDCLSPESGAPEDDPLCAAPARFALQSNDIGSSEPRRSIECAFGLLEHGWEAADETVG